MSNENVYFITSNASDLYFEDSLRVLSAPNKYLIKFRYQKKWIERDLCTTLKKGTEIIILSLTKTSSNTKYELIPLRKAKIKKIIEEGILIQYYLELGDFVCIENCDSYIIENKPELMVFSSETESYSDYTAVRQKKVKCEWEAIVDKLFELKNDSFKKIPLYNVSSLSLKTCKLNDKKVTIKGKQYKLFNNSNYVLRVKMKKSKSSKQSTIKIECDNSIIKNLVSEYTLTAPRDNINIDFFTGDLKKDARFSKLILKNTPVRVNTDDSTICEEITGNKYDLNIEVKLSRKKLSYIIFGLLSAVIATATEYELYNFSKIHTFWINYGCAGVLNYLLFPIIIFCVTAGLFWGYDKK